MKQNLSPIQNHIISKLKYAKSLKYSELHPEGLPNDLFNYHLQFLVKKGIFIKTASSYSLSEKGIKLIADPYSPNDTLDSLFKINVITIVTRKVGKEIEVLNQIRKSNPSFGKIGVMGGVVLKGESIQSAASRKLKQETNLDANFKILGCERRIMYKQGELFSDVMFPIAYSDKCSGDLLADTEFGHNMWVLIDEAIKNEFGNFDTIKSITTVLKAIKADKIKRLKTFFEEITQSDEII